MDYREHFVPRGQHRIYAREHEGEGPTIILMHGFPDNLHLYDRLVPHLSGRRVVVFDFLGWGASDKPTGYPYTADNQTWDLQAVIEHLDVCCVVRQCKKEAIRPLPDQRSIGWPNPSLPHSLPFWKRP